MTQERLVLHFYGYRLGLSEEKMYDDVIEQHREERARVIEREGTQ